MLQAFKCPSCSAPLEYEGGDFQKCDFCGGNVLVPKNEMESGAGLGFDSIIGKAHKLKEILNLIRSGRKIEAIKEYRETFGCGLAEAKDAIEKLERGESVSFQNVSFQTLVTLSPETQKKALKFAGIFGGSMLLIAIVPLIIGLAIAGFVVWRVTGTINKAKSNETVPAKSGFAEEVLKFGAKGMGAGQFEDNRAIAVGRNGKIYVAEFEGGKIQVFDADGKFINQWTATGVNYLSHMVADRKGNIYIISSRKMLCFEGETGKLLAERDGLDIDGITVSFDGKLIAPSSFGGIMIFGSDLKTLAEYKDAGKQASAKSRLKLAAVDGNGTIYVTDAQNGDLVKFSSGGQFLNRIKTNWGRAPNAIAVDGKGRILLSDASTIQVLDADGGKIASFPATQAFGMAFNDAGELLVASRPYVVKYKVNN